MTRRTVLLSWSSGKDSAWALHLLRQDASLDVVGLLTTVNRRFDRVAMHAVRRELLMRQAEAAGLEPWVVEIPHPCPNEAYEEVMAETLGRARAEGIDAVAFGDLFLEDVRRYREEHMAGTGIEPLFPLWQRDTTALAHEMIEGGIGAYVTCVDPKALDPSFAGRAWDAAFLADLPEGVDACGENGEFHTVVVAGPMFAEPIPVTSGDIVEREGFVFADVLPA